MTYRAPVADIAFALKHGAGFGAALADGLYGDLDRGRWSTPCWRRPAGSPPTCIAPLNARRRPPRHAVQGRRRHHAARLEGGLSRLGRRRLERARGADAMGRPGAAACAQRRLHRDVELGLHGLRHRPGADHGRGSKRWPRTAATTLKRGYLPKLVSGEWMGTMQLTEPQAGSDVGALRTKAERAGDGSYRITGQKIFITYGEHDLTDNIIHFVLARLPDAPPGTRGISLFLVPKFLLNADGSPGARNDVRAHSIEHKLGIHASPTCTMVLRRSRRRDRLPRRRGEPRHGLHVHHDEPRAARGRAAGRRASPSAPRSRRSPMRASASKAAQPARMTASSPIIAHPDVKRMLLTMRALTRAARAICYATAVAHRPRRSAAATTARARPRTSAPRCSRRSPRRSRPTSASRSPRSACRCTAAWASSRRPARRSIYRDARIAAIYEGTNGIQAIDLVTRKLPLSGGARGRRPISPSCARTVDAVNAANDPAFGATGARLAEAVDSLERATAVAARRSSRRTPTAALAGATPYLRLFALCRRRLHCWPTRRWRRAARGNGDAAPRIAIARFFAENIAVQAGGLERTVTEGADSVNSAEAALA